MAKKEKQKAVEKPKQKNSVSKWIKDNKTFVIALCIILVLMITSFILTQTMMTGHFEFNSLTQEYEFVKSADPKFPFWKFALSPFLMFSTSSGITVATIVGFLFIISGVMEIMQKTKVINYIFDRLVNRFKKHRHLLLIILVSFFMAIGSLIGCFDEIIPFVPLLIILVAKFGFDKHMGISVSLFAIAAGFASGIFNPFVVGIPQEEADVPQFSGAWMRVILFFVLLAFICAFVLFKARKTNKDNSLVNEIVEVESKSDPTLNKASLAFGLCIFVGFTFVILNLFVPALKNLNISSLWILAAAFLMGGIFTAIITKFPAKKFFGEFTKGLKSTLLAAILLILASSISYILKNGTAGNPLNDNTTMNRILYLFFSATQGVSKFTIVFLFYLIFLLFSVFIASGSAKATLLIPILAPIAGLVPGADPNYGVIYPMILAFALADGMASLVYPTNPVLIVILNMTDTSYGEYIKKNWAFFVGFFLISIGIIAFACGVNYGPNPF